MVTGETRIPLSVPKWYDCLGFGGCLGDVGYYLTPDEFAEKSRLTAEFPTVSFNFFRSVPQRMRRGRRGLRCQGPRGHKLKTS